MQGPETDTYNLVSWNHGDNIVRIQPLSEPTSQSKPLLQNDLIDEITAYGSNPNSNCLWFGHKSGRISVYQCLSNYDNEKSYIRNRQSSSGIKLSYNSAFRTISFRNSFKLNENDYENRRYSKGSNTSEYYQTMQWQGPIYLIRHTDEITCICVSTEFQIVVSAGRDGLAVIWDSNSYSYIRTIERPFEIQHSPISVVVVSPTLGDILTVHTIEKFGNHTLTNNTNNNNCASSNIRENDECFEVTEENLEDFVNISMNVNGKSIMRLHSVNAKYIGHYILEDKKVLSACYSYIKEGTGINVVATGLEDGIIRFWSSWDLTFIQEIIISNSDIISVTYSTYQHLIALSKDNFIQVWESEGIQENSPKFPQIFFNKANSLL